MTRSEMDQKVRLFAQAKNKLKDLMKEFVKDKSIPVPNRWALFYTSDLGDKPWEIPSFLDVQIPNWRNYVSYDQRDEVTPEDLAQELYFYADEDDEEFKDIFGITHVEMEEKIQELFMENFIEHFVWDW